MNDVRVWTILILAVVLAACSKPATPAPTQAPPPTGAPNVQDTAAPAASANTPDPCLLMTKDEAGQLIGRPVTSATALNPKACVYESSDANTLKIVVGEDWSNAAEMEKGTRDLAGQNITPIPGLGDAAFFTDIDLFVRKGDVDFYIQTDFMTAVPGLTKDKLQAEAAKMVTRLP